ncbi:diguanylate cyclase [Salinicola aestuarinus]|uniref:diguanylate cyclase n=1 Tax=Salinicola aestuarinus TaxID=1949082 RepID=UPI000DA1F47B|nr:diguanylate cyclase [Salinicola aestuarinus]
MPDTTLDPEQRRRQSGAKLARRLYLPRTLGLIVGGTCVAGTLHTLSTPLWIWISLGLEVALWSHIAYWRARRHESPYHAERQNLCVDSLLVGLWLAAMHFSVLPSVASATMVSLDNIAVGGLRLLAMGLGSMAVGALFGILMIRPESIILDASPEVLFTSLPLVLIYPLAVGYVSYRQARQLVRQKRALRSLSRTDGLTGLLNRRIWRAQLSATLLKPSKATIALLDIDHFKRINDEHGHDVGDATLCSVADALTETFPPPAVVCRYGGEEFGVLLPDTGLDEAVATLAHWQRRLARHTPPDALMRMPTCSIGLAVRHPRFEDHDSWLVAADRALYAAKHSGRDRIEVSSQSASQLALDLS